jgi:hypothetical protein
MKKMHSLTLALSVTLLAGNLAPSFADVYVKVDANGNAIGGAIMCDAGTCGAGSEYSRLTLQEGERYVLQGTGHAGIGNNNPNTQVKVDLETNEWTITREVIVTPIEPVVINNQPVLSYTTQTVEKFNPITPVIITPATPIVVVETATAMADTNTATVETVTAKTSNNIMPNDYYSPDWWERFIAWFELYIEQLFGKVDNDD